MMPSLHKVNMEYCFLFHVHGSPNTVCHQMLYSALPETPDLFFPTVFCEHLLRIRCFLFAMLVEFLLLFFSLFFWGFVFVESFILVTLKHL